MNLDAQLERFAGMTVMTDEEHAKWFFENCIVKYLRNGGVEKRFWYEITEWSEPSQAAVFRRVRSLVSGKGAIIAMVGKRGTGKTTVAVQTMIDLIRKWHDWNHTMPSRRVGEPPVGLGLYVKAIEAIARLKAIYSDHGTIALDEVMEYRDSLASCGLLVIDEKHDADELKATDRMLTDILDRRYSARKDSIIISNQTEQEFRATTNPSILSRIAEHGLIIPCEWSSFRRQQ